MLCPTQRRLLSPVGTTALEHMVILWGFAIRLNYRGPDSTCALLAEYQTERRAELAGRVPASTARGNRVKMASTRGETHVGRIANRFPGLGARRGH